MDKKKKNRKIDWNFVIAYILGSLLKSVIQEFIGFNHDSPIKLFSTIFWEDFGLFMACYLGVYICLTFIKNKIKK